jgi:hypothetical protein
MGNERRIGTGGIIVLVIVALWLYGSLKGDDDDSPSEPVAPLVSASDVSVVRSMSFCSPEPFAAQVRFVVWVSNRGSAPAEVSILPVRYYSDGEDNRSILDVVTATIEPGRRQFVDQLFSYNAQEHAVIRCAVEFGLKGNPLGREMPIRVS